MYNSVENLRKNNKQYTHTHTQLKSPQASIGLTVRCGRGAEPAWGLAGSSCTAAGQAREAGVGGRRKGAQSWPARPENQEYTAEEQSQLVLKESACIALCLVANYFAGCSILASFLVCKCVHFYTKSVTYTHTHIGLTVRCGRGAEPAWGLAGSSCTAAGQAKEGGIDTVGVGGGGKRARRAGRPGQRTRSTRQKSRASSCLKSVPA